MQSLRKLKERKRAIAHQMTASLSKTVDLKLATRGMDIVYLNKERDQITRDREKEFDELKKQLNEERDQMMRRLEAMEATSARYDSLVGRPETLKLVNVAVKPLAERLEVLERSAAGLPDLYKGLQDLATVPNRLATIETRQTVVQPKPEPKPSVLDNSHLKYLTDGLRSLEAANDALARIPRLENDITMLKNMKELHKIDIDTLKKWKDAQPKAVFEETMKNLITTEVQAKASILSERLREKADEANGQLAERITRNETSIRDIRTQSESLQSFKEKVEKQKLSNQLSALHEKVKMAEGNDARTFAKADRLQKRLEELEDEVPANEMDKMHDRIDKLQDKLKEYREETKDTDRKVKQLQDDAFDFQDVHKDIYKYIEPLKDHYKKRGSHLTQWVATLETTVTQSDLGILPVRLDELEKSARNLDKLSTRVNELEKTTKGPGFKKAGTPVLPSSVLDTPAMGSLDEKVNSLDKSLQQLRKDVMGKGSLISRLDAQDKRIDSIEATASARPLDTEKQTTEMTASRILDKTVEKTTETKVKALMLHERKIVDKSLEELETRLMEKIQASRNRTHESSVPSADATVAQSDVTGLNNLIYNIEKDIETLSDDLGKTEERIVAQDQTINFLQDFVPTLFNQHFDPLKVNVEDQLRVINIALETHGSDLSNLSQQVSNLPLQQNTFGQQQQAQLEATVVDAATLKTNLEALKESLSTKADTERMSQQLEGIIFAMQHIQSRYENISTDDIYQRMVKWFTQMYPGLSQIQDDISQLKALKAWIDPRANALNGLSRDAEHLYGLVSIASQLQDLVNVAPQVLCLASKSALLQSLANNVPAPGRLI